MSTAIASNINASGQGSWVQFATAAEQIDFTGVFAGAKCLVKVSTDNGSTWSYATGPNGAPMLVQAPSRLPISMLDGDYLSIETLDANPNLTDISVAGLP